MPCPGLDLMLFPPLAGICSPAEIEISETGGKTVSEAGGDAVVLPDKLLGAELLDIAGQMARQNGGIIIRSAGDNRFEHAENPRAVFFFEKPAVLAQLRR